ncbi:MAG: aromatic ring-hydroxylating dioxygenase subunit alpha [Myxococcales bacterium]|nr:aromatic ring-hydroxylating dioxygenase subunit alpha [Myxococcales bacterium]
MTYLRNTWYIGGWDYEITRSLTMRTMLEEPVLLFRKENGEAVAMSDKCPHRYAPLHKGSLLGDTVQCRYHGLEFNSAGRCVSPPRPGCNGVAPNARVKTFPTVERMGAVWVWMGDEAPDEALLPDYSCISDTKSYRTIRGVFDIDNHYEMCNDNALDLTHVTFTHAGTLGAGLDNVRNEQVKRERVGNTLWCRRFNYDIAAGADFQRFNPALQTVKVDKQQNVRWDPPGNIMIIIRYVQAGTESTHYTSISAGNILTPIGPTKTRFYWSVSRTFGLDSEHLDRAMTASAELALQRQDKPMIEDQLALMKTTDLEILQPVYIADDATPVHARKVLRKLIESERERQQARPTSGPARDSVPAPAM